MRFVLNVLAGAVGFALMMLIAFNFLIWLEGIRLAIQ